MSANDKNAVAARSRQDRLALGAVFGVMAAMIPRLVCSFPARLSPVLATIVALALAPTLAAADANWPRWRGPRDNGTAESGNYPVKWDAQANLLWKTPLPGKGCSTPAVWDGRIYVTAPAGGEDAVLGLSWSGEILWQTKLGPETPGRNKNASGCNPSPATDGTAVVVGFKSGRFAVLGLDGKVRWQVNIIERFGPENLFWDYGISPVLTKRDVIVARMHNGESWLAAFDKATGEMRWKAARNYETPRENDNSYATPAVITFRGREALLTWGGEHLTVHDAADGRLLWSCQMPNPDRGQNWPSVAMPALAGDMIVVPFARNDRGIPRLHGVKLDGEGDVTATNHVWKRTDTGTFVPCPAVYQGRVFLARDLGEVECLDPATGRTVWAGAFPKKGGSKIYGSPVIADGRMFAVREDGTVFVARVADGFELLAENSVGERVIASPVLVAGRVLIRGEKHLFCFGTK
jgi:outer membrane protein assembly factor BamB